MPRSRRDRLIFGLKVSDRRNLTLVNFSRP